MYAVVKTGGKQYRVQPGMFLEVEKLDGEVGQEVSFGEVLLVNQDGEVNVGRPVVQGASVRAEIVEQKRGPRLIIFKKIRRRGKELSKGHRQWLTRVKINDISLS